MSKIMGITVAARIQLFMGKWVYRIKNLVCVFFYQGNYTVIRGNLHSGNHSSPNGSTG